MWRTKVFAGMLIAVGAASSAFASTVSAVYDRELPSDRVESFSLDNTKGDVKILPTGGFTIQIRAVKSVNGPDRKECDALVAQLQVETKQLGTAVEVTHSNLGNPDYTATIDYTIYIPANIDVKVQTDDGQIVCKDRSAEGDFETTNGDISLVNYNGPVQARSQNGNISIDGSTADARFSSINGRLNLTLALAENGNLKAETTNGSVHVDLPGNVSAKLNAETTNGRVSGGAFANVLSMNKSRNFAAGKLGNGSGTVDLNSVNGSITVDSFGATEVASVASDPPAAETKYVTVVEQQPYIVDDPCYVPIYRPICRFPVQVVLFGGFHHRVWDRGWDHGYYRAPVRVWGGGGYRGGHGASIHRWGRR